MGTESQSVREEGATVGLVEPEERGGPDLQVLLALDGRIEPIPALLHQLPQEVQAVAQAGEPMLLDQGLGQSRGDEQVLGSPGERLLGPADNAGPVGFLERPRAAMGSSGAKSSGSISFRNRSSSSRTPNGTGDPAGLIARDRGKQGIRIDERCRGHDHFSIVKGEGEIGVGVIFPCEGGLEAGD